MRGTAIADRYEAGRTIRADGHCRILRAVRRADGTPVLLKGPGRKPASAALHDELLRQAELREWLDEAGLAGAGDLVETDDGRALEIRHVPGRTLAEIAASAPLSPPDFFALALPLADWLRRLHEAGRLHHGIHPWALVAAGPDHELEVHAFDWGSSTPLDGTGPASGDPAPWVGELVAYASPERTGRTRHRPWVPSDLYSLGCVLYHLLCGTAPFEADEPGRLVHAHLARAPDPPARRSRQVPDALSEVVLELLAKDPGERIPTASALLHELQRLASGLRRTGTVSAGRPRPPPRSFRLPDRAFGRDPEVRELQEAIRATAGGAVGAVVVEGPPGIGKTRLVADLRDPVREAGGSMVTGKFEQGGGEAPYAAVVEAFRTLVRHHLGEPGDTFTARRDRLLARLGGNARVIVDAIPEFEHLVGSLPPPPELPLAEARNRFRFAFREFVEAFTAPGHPLVLALDDLHWADGASLDLLLHLLAGSGGHILLVGTVRGEELGDGHPLPSFLERLDRSEVAVRRVTLDPLPASVVEELVVEAFAAPRDRARELAGLLVHRTDGNPLFVRETLERLHHDGLLRYDPGTGEWRWDLDEVRAHSLSDNVAELITQRLLRLGPEARRLVSVAAWLGNRFDARTLSVAMETPLPRLRRPLEQAVELGILAPGPAGGSPDGAAVEGYRFLHDRVQQVAGALVPLTRSEDRHAAIGRAMLDRWPEAELRTRVFEVLRHLGPALDRLDADERDRVAELALLAGRRAAASMDYATAVHHLRDGLRALRGRFGEEVEGRRRALSLELGRSLFFVGEAAEGRMHLRSALELSRTSLERARAHRVRVVCATLTGDESEVLEAGAAGLAELGVRLPLDPGPIRLGRALLLSRVRIRGRSPHDLLELPEMEAPEPRVALEILIDMSTFAYSRSAELAGLVFLTMTNLILRHGLVDLASYVFAIYGQVIASGLGRYEEAHAFGQTALELTRRYDQPLLTGRTRFTCSVLLNHWLRDAREDLADFREARELQMSSGDLLWVTYTNAQFDMLGVFLGHPLDEVAEKATEYLDFAASARYRDVRPYHIATRLWAQDLAGHTASPGSWDGEPHDEEELEREMERAAFTPAVAYGRILRLYGLALMGEVDRALDAVDRLLPVHASAGQLFEAEALFAEGLALMGHLRREGQGGRGPIRRRLRAIVKRFRRWSGLCPVNFEGRRAILASGLATSDPGAAVRELTAAVEAARAAGHVHIRAVALELLARTHLRAGEGRKAQLALESAMAAFREWGAHGKAGQLAGEFPWLAGARPGPEAPTGVPEEAAGADPVDVASLLRVGRASSEETVLGSLLAGVVQACVETAGARRGALVVEGDGDAELRVEAWAGPEGETSPTPPVALDDAPLAASIVRYVGRTGETVVLDDAVGQTRFGLDPRTAGLPHLSVLCTPLTHRGRRTGILYLENELVAGAFTPERTRLLEVLAHQAAVSLENARVRDESRVLLEAAGRFVPGPMVRALGRESVAELEPGDAVEREMSVLFSDLRGYTRRSENLDARESFRWLNDYLERISPVVGVYGGFVDRFVGDATMALFPDGVEGAVRAAVAMLKEVRSLNADRSEVPGAGDFHAGIGLHFGSVMLGAVGSSGRMEITSIGDAVNVAARLENATKPLDAALLISGAVARRLPPEHGLTLRTVGRLGVEGRATPLEVWEVLDGESPERAEAKGRVSDLLARGIERFQEGEMTGAADLFETCMEDSSSDAVARTYLEASRDLAAEGFPEEWSGELRLGKG